MQDLHQRLDRTRWPDASPALPWQQGVDRGWLERLLQRWRQFDWAAAQQRLNRLPQYTLVVDGERLHFVHLRSGAGRGLPLLLAHGWPGSFVEFVEVAQRLADPAAFGLAGPPRDVVVPSLPGFGYSEAPRQAGCAPAAIASRWLALMSALGHERFVVQGGDLGASVGVCMARQAPSRLAGLHLNYIPATYRPHDPAGLTVEEEAFLARRQQWADLEGAYAHLHGTKPQTLAYALADSPAGLAAWIGEKFETWTASGIGLDGGPLLEALLTHLSLYWFTGTAASSMRLYWETRRAPLQFAPGETVGVPLGVTQCPSELPMPPRRWVERGFTDLRRWTLLPRGGHFAALEEPALFSAELLDFVSSLETAPDAPRRPPR